MHAIHMHIIPSSFSPSDRHSYNKHADAWTDRQTHRLMRYLQTHTPTIRYGGCSTFHVVITFDTCGDECARFDVCRASL